VHELPFTQSLFDLVATHAANGEGGRVTDVHVVVGELSGISPECVSLYWEVVSRGSCAEGSALHFRRVPLAFVCRACEGTFGSEAVDYTCPHCGSLRVRVTAGSELNLEAIDVEPRGAPALIRTGMDAKEVT